MITRWYLRLYFLFLLAATIATALASDSPQQLFNEGNRQYAAGDYKAALGSYFALLEKKIESPELYFNIGNVYYKTKEIPSAILFYERALRLSPGDEDILFNLRMVNLEVVDKIEPMPRLFYERWWERFTGLSGPDGWAIANLLFTLFTAAFAGLLMVFKQTSFRKILWPAAFIFALASLLTYTAAGFRTRQLFETDYAVLFSPSVYVKSAPDEKTTDLFILHEGTKVEILDTLNEWRRIKIADGRQGWIKDESLRVI